MSYEPVFWNGHRMFDAQRAMELEGQKADDFRAAARDYYRLFNDGDTPHHARFMRLCRVAGIETDARMRTDPQTQDRLIERLLNRALGV